MTVEAAIIGPMLVLYSVLKNIRPRESVYRLESLM